MSRFTAECPIGGPCRIRDDRDGTIVAVIPAGPHSERWAERILMTLADTEALPTLALQQGWVRLAVQLTGHLLNPTGHTDTCMETVAMLRANGIRAGCGRICGALRALRSAVIGEPVRAVAGFSGSDWDTPIPVLAPDTFTNPRHAAVESGRSVTLS